MLTEIIRTVLCVSRN